MSCGCDKTSDMGTDLVEMLVNPHRAAKMDERRKLNPGQPCGCSAAPIAQNERSAQPTGGWLAPPTTAFVPPIVKELCHHQFVPNLYYPHKWDRREWHPHELYYDVWLWPECCMNSPCGCHSDAEWCCMDGCSFCHYPAKPVCP
jgi:hypothetical protein